MFRSVSATLACTPLLIQTSRSLASHTSLLLAAYTGNNVKVGHHITTPSDGIIKVLRTSHVRAGKGGAFNNLEGVSVKTGKKVSLRLRSDEKVERMAFEPPEPYDVLYAEGETVHLMHPETFEQVEIGVEIVQEELRPYLVDGVRLEVTSHGGSPVLVEFPKLVSVLVEGTDGKTATLANGVSLSVPEFIKGGDLVEVNMGTGEYHSRVQ